MRRALILTAVDPRLGGVLILGDRGTGKSTAVRALAALLPPIEAVEGCPVNSARPEDVPAWVDPAPGPATRLVPTPVVDLPLGAAEDRVTGALDIERALVEGVRAFQPGLLAAANRGYLYVDEVNLLEDHVVDLLLDVAQTGENLVEREGLSIRHPARFVLVGSGNPEEGELRPQLLDRFGLSVDARTPTDIDARVAVIRRRDAFDRDPGRVHAGLGRGRRRAARPDPRGARAAGRGRGARGGAPRLRGALRGAGLGRGCAGELALLRAARALAAFEGADAVGRPELRAMAPSALRHRLRRDPLDESGSTAPGRASDGGGLGVIPGPGAPIAGSGAGAGRSGRLSEARGEAARLPGVGAGAARRRMEGAGVARVGPGGGGGAGGRSDRPGRPAAARTALAAARRRPGRAGGRDGTGFGGSIRRRTTTRCWAVWTRWPRSPSAES